MGRAIERGYTYLVENLENLSASELEQKENEYWSSIDILNQTIENREGCEGHGGRYNLAYLGKGLAISDD